jgi:flagellar biosynthesis GTPase FlhF
MAQLQPRGQATKALYVELCSSIEDHDADSGSHAIEAMVEGAETAASDSDEHDAVVFTPEQEWITRTIVSNVEDGMQHRQTREEQWRSEKARAPVESEDEVERWWRWGIDDREQKQQHMLNGRHVMAVLGCAHSDLRTGRRALAIIGATGSGKTTAVEAGIEECGERLRARVQIVATSRWLVGRYRAKYPYFHVNTVHDAYNLHEKVQETRKLMCPYDLILVDDVGQLSQLAFERLLTLWLAAERFPALVFTGDFSQFPGIEATTAWNSPHWHSRLVQKLLMYKVTSDCMNTVE